MSPLAVALFVSLALAEIQSGSAVLRPRPRPTRNMKPLRFIAPGSNYKTRPKTILSTTSPTAEVSTTEQTIIQHVHTSQPQKRQCLNLDERCIDSELFCCKSQRLDNGTLVHIDGFCKVFSEHCVSRLIYDHYDDYVSMAMRLDGRTWERLNP